MASGRSKGDVFVRADLLAMRRRLADAARMVRTDRVPEEFARYGDVSGVITTNFYGATDLIVDILSGEVPSVCTVPMPTLADLWLPVYAVTSIALARRLTALVDDDRFVSTPALAETASKMWPAKSRELMKILARLRDARTIRFEEKLDEKNGKIRYRQAIADCMREGEAMFGPTGMKPVDAVLKRLVSTKFRQAA